MGGLSVQAITLTKDEHTLVMQWRTMVAVTGYGKLLACAVDGRLESVEPTPHIRRADLTKSARSDTDIGT
jgi:hypothetical protein